MNYLETGLPHTQFYPKKTQFSPPRFIPLCGLSRKYLGLEPLSRKEVDILIRRLSEPKKTPDTDEPAYLAQPRPRSSPWSGRFVGQKKMSSLEIEQMVSRLCSGRSNKDSTSADANEDTTVTSDDDSSDSEDDLQLNSNKSDVNLPKNENIIRRHSSIGSVRSEPRFTETIRRQSILTSARRQSGSPKRKDSNTDFTPSSPKRSFDSGVRGKVSPRSPRIKRAHFETDPGPRRESVMNVKKPESAKLFAPRVSFDKGTKEACDIANFKPQVKHRPSVSFSRGSYFCANRRRRQIKPSRHYSERIDEFTDNDDDDEAEPEDISVNRNISVNRPISFHGKFTARRSESQESVQEKKIDLTAMFAGIPKTIRAAELTRPPPSVVELTLEPEKKADTNVELKVDEVKSTKTFGGSKNSKTDKEGVESVLFESIIQTNLNNTGASPRSSQFPKIEEVRGKRCPVNPNDDLVIEKVASYNRGRKYRSKR